ncbi:MAG: Xylose isomerase [candidate division BRC1 bacterium ADurb.BinA364]|nr:MAG: Xylose isomerase [candidate division BRC1 bacterium ADurb.BinA364]
MPDLTKHAVITGFLSATKDRFHEYNRLIALEERLRLAASMEGVSGVEMVYPYEVGQEAEAARDLVARHSLSIAAINVNVKAEPEFRDGGLTSPDAKIRAKAIEFIHRAKDFALTAGADKVTCCPLSDGYEFNFQADYAKAWNRIVDSLREAASYKTEIPLFIEYKPSETRARCYIDTAAKALLLLHEIGVKDMGVTLDFGHSMYGNENPAEAVSMLAASPFRYYIHINDNNARWDWDFMAGTHHFLDYVEFLFVLMKNGYSDFFTSDTWPTRWDIRKTFEMNARLTNKIWRRLQAIGIEALQARIDAGDYLATWEWIETNLLSL